MDYDRKMEPTEVARYLQDHPAFFEQHADVFINLKVPHPHEGKAISLGERQILTLREKLRTVELRMAALLRNAAENEHIADNLQRWSRALLKEPVPRNLPAALTSGLAEIFTVPYVALRLWSVPGETTADIDEVWRADVTDDLRRFATSLMSPYCGPNTGFEAANLLETPPASVALIPLRVGLAPQAFGLLVLGSPDPDRFSPGMGTAFLGRMGEIASASLSRLQTS